MKGSRTIAINAPAKTVYDLVSDPQNYPKWSPEATAIKWLGGASGPAVGAKFRGSNKRGAIPWQTTCRILDATSPTRFEFVVELVGKRLTYWTYEIKETGPNDCELTESFNRVMSVPGIGVFYRVMKTPDRTKALEENLAESIAGVKEIAENS